MKPETLINRVVPTLYEDEHLLAVAKPAGIDAGGSTSRSTEGLAEILAEARGGDERLEPANRLGRYESGVLLLCKEPEIGRHIRTGLRSMRIVQEYLAVAVGQMRKSPISIGPDRAEPRGLRKRPQAEGKRPTRTTRPASITTLRLVRQSERRVLIRCRTAVPNTHALRAQLRAAGLRLLGDSVNDRSRRPKSPRLTCLHLQRIAFHYPPIKAKLTVTSKPPEEFDGILEGGHDAGRMLPAALARRLTCAAWPDTDSYRLLTGDAEGLKGIIAEKYGDVVILQVFDEQWGSPESLKPVARWYRGTLGVKAVYAKRFVKDRLDTEEQAGRKSRRNELLDSSTPLVGKSVGEQLVIRENGLRFAVRPDARFSVGLFLDHRDNRSRIRSMAEGKDVLNLFAYTCGFSVAAAAGGAKSTVSVDIASNHLNWGRTNFELNGLDLTNHRFVQSDASDYLRRAERRGSRFDLIVLDPPTFAHGRKRKHSFSVTRDLVGLIAAVVEVLNPGGVLMLSTSYRRFSLRDLRDRVKQGAGPRGFRVSATPPLPVDFAMDPDHAKTLFVRFK